MSETTFEPSEMRTSYTEFMNAYEKIRNSFGLRDDFFKDKFFSTVLSEILKKFMESENASLKEIESVGLDDNKLTLCASEQLEPQSPDDTDHISAKPQDFAGFLYGLLGTFKQFDDFKKPRFIVFLICQKIPFYKEKHQDLYQNILKSNGDEDFFDYIWQSISDQELIVKLSETKLWHKTVRENLPDLYNSYFNDQILIDMNIYKFFRDNIKHISETANKYPNVDLFPSMLNKDGVLCCLLTSWQTNIKDFKEYEIQSPLNDISGNDVAIFESPTLVTKNDKGHIEGIIWSSHRPKLIGYGNIQKTSGYK